MTPHYYIDESGNTGDLARTGPDLSFGGQPIFSLACVGIEDTAELASAVDLLKRDHRVALSELKASQLHSRPTFVLALLDLLFERRCPVMIEVVEKRFMVAAHIVNHQLMNGGHHVGDPDGEALARALAEFIGQAAPDAVLAGFIEACVDPGPTSVIRALELVRDWSKAFAPAFELTEITSGLAELALTELEPDASGDAPYSYRRFLPVPDNSPSGKPMWMLPGLSSFTNLYARLNLLHGRRLADIVVVHDEQRYLEGALRGGKQSMEDLRHHLTKAGARFADYDLSSPGKLEFRRSDTEIGLQIADVIAGSIARHMKTVLTDSAAERPLQPIVNRLASFGYAPLGLGINFVATERLLRAAQIGFY